VGRAAALLLRLGPVPVYPPQPLLVLPRRRPGHNPADQREPRRQGQRRHRLHTEGNTDKLASHADQLLALQKHIEDNTDKLSKLVTGTAPQLLAVNGVLASQQDQLLDMQKQQVDMLRSLSVIQVAIADIQARLTSDPAS
jgi:hypothetical protein